MPLLPAIVCKCTNCQKPMFLPDAKFRHHEQRAWPADGAPRPFICPVCKKQYVYSVGDVRLVDQYPLQKVHNIIHISVRCREKKCDSGSARGPRSIKGRIETRTLLAFDVPEHMIRDEALKMFTQFSRKTAKVVRCDNGHILATWHYNPEVRDAAGYDRAWEHRKPSE